MAWPRESYRAGRHPTRLPARPQPRVAAGRASVALSRRAARQPLLRDHRGTRRRGRRALPRPHAADPNHQRMHALPLVAAPDIPESPMKESIGVGMTGLALLRRLERFGLRRTPG